jgi:TolB-like protein/tetratricopeptide (TPR) repeat protein
MPSVVPDFEYDIFISYRHNDNAYDNWVSEFVANLKKELNATIKGKINIYYDANADDGLLEMNNVDESLSPKIKSLVFIPIVSQTYCDPESFAWRNEFVAFNKMAAQDKLGATIKLSNGNVANRILPIKIHALDSADVEMLEHELKSPLRPIDFIYKTAGVNRPLRPKDDDVRVSNAQLIYRDQINKVANAVKDIIGGAKSLSEGRPTLKINRDQSIDIEKSNGSVWLKIKKNNIFKVTVVSVLLIGLGYFGFLKFVESLLPFNTEGIAGDIKKSIAVLPFENLTNEPELETFCDGLTEEILNHLSKLSSLDVTSRTSVKKYKGTTASVLEIAKELSVTHILEGSVRKSGNKIRITAQLIDAKTDKHIWSDDYDYTELKDIFPVQTNVSTRVTEVLKLKLTTQEKASLSKTYSGNMEAYKLYLRGRFFWDKRNREGLDSAEACFNKALAIDPQYALAYSGLADCYIFNSKGLTQLEAIPIAEMYARKALSLDSTMCEAWTTIGFVQSHYNFQWKEGMVTLKKAIRCNPNYQYAHVYLGNILLFNGKTEEGLDETKKGLSLDPLSAGVNWALGRNYFHARKYDLAIEQLKKTVVMRPDYWLAWETLAETYTAMKQYPLALEALAKLPSIISINGPHGFLPVYVHAIMGNKSKAMDLLGKSLGQIGQGSPTRLAIVYTGLGDIMKAQEELEKGYQLHALHMIFINTDPALDPLRSEPRFKALIKNMNFE